MARTAIVTDASTDLRPEHANALNIFVAPLGYEVGGKLYRSGDQTAAELYAAVDGATSATVEGVAADDFEEAFHAAAGSSTDIICACHSVGSSFTRVSAEVASHRITADEASVRLISPGRSTTALAAICLAGASAAAAGSEPEAVLGVIEEASTVADAYFIARDLSQLERGGQLAVVSSQSNVGSLEDGVPLFRVRGRLTAVSVHPTNESAETAMIESIERQAGGRPIVLVSTHADADGDRERLAAAARSALAVNDEHTTEMGPVVATLLGRGAYGLGFCAAPAGS